MCLTLWLNWASHPLKSWQYRARKKGLVARFIIFKGIRILSKPTFFTTPQLSPIGFLENTIVTKLKSLSKTQQRQFLLLHNNFPGKHLFSGIVTTNALPCAPDSLIGVIYPTICFINHICLPNTHKSRNFNSNHQTIQAVHDIPKGEEITVPYNTFRWTPQRRIPLPLYLLDLLPPTS